MQSAMLAIVLCAAAGCSGSNPPTPHTPPPTAAEPPDVLPLSVSPAAGGVLEPPTVSRSASKASIAELRKIADDPRATRDARSAAVFALFANHLRPPVGPAAAGKVLGEANWLKDSHLHGALQGLAGWMPVDFGGDGDSVFCIKLFPDKDGRSEWRIWLRLSGGTRLSEGEALRVFLRGGEGLKDPPALVEFALCYPSPGELEYGRYENFGPKGMTVLGEDVVEKK